MDENNETLETTALLSNESELSFFSTAADNTPQQDVHVLEPPINSTERNLIRTGHFPTIIVHAPFDSPVADIPDVPTSDHTHSIWVPVRIRFSEIS